METYNPNPDLYTDQVLYQRKGLNSRGTLRHKATQRSD